MEDFEQSVKDLEGILDEGNYSKLPTFFEAFNTVDAAEVLSNSDIENVFIVYKKMEPEYLGEVFSYLPHNIKSRISDILTSEELSKILDHVYTDDVVEFLNELPWAQVQMILSFTDKERRTTITEMLGYPQESAGSMMSTDYIELGQYISVKDAMQVIKEHEGIAEIMDTYYITNIDGVLEGVVSVREILFAPLDDTIENIMSKDIISVSAYEHQEEVSKVVAKYDLSFVPVIDNNNKLVGLISTDDIIDVVEEEATEDIHRMGGISWLSGEYLETPAQVIAKKRISWLLILAIVYTISSLVIIGFKDIIFAIPSLILFIPLLMDTAGDAGSQSLAMVIRGIAVDNIDTSYYKEVFLKELGVSSLIGVILFAFNFVRIYFASAAAGNFNLALTVSLTLFIVVIVTKIISGLLPLVALSLKKDPAVVASPLITTISDTLSLILYFSIATLLLGGLI